MRPTNTPSSQPPKLLDPVRERIRIKHYSIRTETQYIQWVRRFVLYDDKRHPREMGTPEVQAFLTHLAVDGQALPAPMFRRSGSGSAAPIVCIALKTENTAAPAAAPGPARR